MNDWTIIAGLTLAAGIAMPIGAAFASFERILPRWLEAEFQHSVIAFGGGALLSAIALALVPEGSASLSIPWAAFWFSAGGVAFMGLDILLNRIKSPAGQLVAMLSDFLPEAAALGATFAMRNETGLLLAGLMALQNLPEGFNAYRELTVRARLRGSHVIGAFAAMALLGPLAGLAGHFWLAGHPAVIAAIMLFAAGGILYIIFQDIAPQVPLERHWAPPLGALGGFLLGLVGQMLTSA